jgi:transcriptional regulator with XRE-family HTH domain
MPEIHKRPAPRPPLGELIALRQAKFPLLKTRDFAAMLGISRLHLNAVEQGRREVSLDLALRWLDVLSPHARMHMFGPLPVVEARIRAIKRLVAVAPEIFEAA